VTTTVAARVPAFAGLRRGTSWLVDMLRRRPEVLCALLCAVVLALGIRGPDLPAQNYRVWLLRTHGLIIFDSHWYAGHTLPGYSLAFPPLAAIVGPRLLGALACVAATAAFTRLLRGRRDTGDDVAILWFAATTVISLAIGRLPFALGVAFGVGALVAVKERRSWWALALAVLCSAASPLAGAFLLLGGVAWLPDIGRRRVLPLTGALLGIGAADVFGEGGFFPFPLWSLLAILGFCTVSFALTPRSERLMRRGFVLYALAAVSLYAVPNPIGGNIIRFGALVAGPVAAYVCLRHNRPVLLAVVAVPLLLWQFWQVPGAVAGSNDSLAAHAGYYKGLSRYIASHGGTNGRVEVPLTQGRWETDYLATSLLLARGWERQVDLAFNRVLYDPHLTARAYHQWLRANAVRWVALPDVPLDSSEGGEAALLTGPELSFLKPVWHDQHWQLWQVKDATPLVRGPATLTDLGVAKVRLAATGPGEATVLLRWTRFWRVTEGVACVEPSPDGWTTVRLFGPGPVTISAQVGLGTLAGGGAGGSCSAGAPDDTTP
jgi:hypothetical protein